MVGASILLGFAGKVEYGPSCTERLLGGLPRSLLFGPLLLPCHALDTAGPCLFLEREGDLLILKGPADFGSSIEGVIGKLCWRCKADSGYGDVGVAVGRSTKFTRNLNCWPPISALSWPDDGVIPVLGVFGAMAT